MDDNINIAICDDDEIDADRIAELCGKSEILSKYNVNISQYHSGEDLCNAKEVYNLIFLDIKLDNMDGIAIRDHLRISQPDALIAYANNKTIIIVRNTDMVNNVSLITTKADVRDHGFGLYNVKKSVKALKGDMKISHRESEFVVTITI